MSAASNVRRAPLERKPPTIRLEERKSETPPMSTACDLSSSKQGRNTVTFIKKREKVANAWPTAPLDDLQPTQQKKEKNMEHYSPPKKRILLQILRTRPSAGKVKKESRPLEEKEKNTKSA